VPGVSRRSGREEGIRAEIEERVAPRGRDRAVGQACPTAEEVEQRDDPAPCAVTLVLLAGLPVPLFTESGMEAREGVSVPVRGRLHGQEAAVFGEEHGHHLEEDGAEPSGEVGCPARAHLAQEGAARAAIRLLEAGQEVFQRADDLHAQGVGDGAPVLAARPEQVVEAPALRRPEEPFRAEEHVQGAQRRAFRGVEHDLQGEAQPAGAVAPGRVDQPELTAVGEKADGDVQLAE
jgi:hypothetical protein